ncbi:MAG: 50S ribosomal protein L29 [Mediterraneibacter gnavus]
MKINTFVNELRAKSVEELNEELVAAKKELFNLRFQNATNQLDNTSRIKEVRKNIARIQTMITRKLLECSGRRTYCRGKKS